MAHGWRGNSDGSVPLKYPVKRCAPRMSSSPRGNGLSVTRYPSSGTSMSFTSVLLCTPPMVPLADGSFGQHVVQQPQFSVIP